MYDVELAWNYFHDAFTNTVNKNAPFRKYRVTDQNNPWFSPQLSSQLKQRDAAWAKATKTRKSQSDWQNFRQLQNCIPSLVKNAQIRLLPPQNHNLLK